MLFKEPSSTLSRKMLIALRATAVSWVFILSPLVSAKSADNLSYSQDQASTAIDIVQKLENKHYRGQRLDDALSSRLLDNYLEKLDGSRSYFLQADLKEFEQYRYKLDDTINKGDLSPGFVIFNRYQQRLTARLEYIIETLPELVANMDFERDEELVLDRSEAQWPANYKEANELWRKRLKNRVISLRISKKEEDEIVPLLIKRFKNQLNRLAQSNSEDAFQLYINSLTSLYDPHTTYFSPRASENFNINMSLSLEGIGAVLQSEDEFTKVVRIVAKGPADKQGELQPSDRIVAVAQGDDDFQDVIGLRLDEVVQLIRGKKNSVVRLEVIPVSAKTDGERSIIKIVRNTVKLEEQSAKKKVLDLYSNEQLYKIGVIDIPAFYIDFDAQRRGDKNYKSTTRDVKKLLEELEQEGVDGIVIDLRNNGGGSLLEANQLTGLFVESGPTVQIRNSSTQVFRDGKRKSSPYYRGPLAVLINRMSASASEIFAGAIQDYDRGIIVGSQSFGKGTVQSLTGLLQGQLKITESKFYRISGESTQHQGVIPDIAFPAFYYDAEKVGESSLDNALPWDRINPIRHRKYHQIDYIIPELQLKHMERVKNDPDFIFLQDQLSLLEASRKLKTLPLNEKTRNEYYEEEKEKGQIIENKRRLAKGLEPLEIDEDTEADENVADETVTETEQSDDENDEPSDTLLTETGYILVDSFPIFMGNKYVAKNLPRSETKKQ